MLVSFSMFPPTPAVNCTKSELPDLTVRTDVVTTEDWDNVTVTYDTKVK